jgi:hypothetical protein
VGSLDALCLEYVDRGYGKCIAAFASAQDKKPRPEFEWRQTLEALPVDILFLKDNGRRWYLDCGVEEVLKRFNPYMLIGASMGGYAALMYGAGRQVRAFSPQTAISSVWRKENADTRFADFIPDGPDLEVAGENFHIHYCLHNPLDRLHAERTKARLFPHNCDSHKVAQKIEVAEWLYA